MQRCPEFLNAPYVANRTVWLNGPLGFLSQLSPAVFAKYGLYPYPGTGPADYNNYADYQLLGQPLNSVADAPDAVMRNGGPRPRLDLWALNRAAVVSSGVPPAHVELAEVCTRCHSEVPPVSARRTKTIVRHMRVRANITAEEAQAILQYLTQ